MFEYGFSILNLVLVECGGGEGRGGGGDNGGLINLCHHENCWELFHLVTKKERRIIKKCSFINQ